MTDTKVADGVLSSLMVLFADQWQRFVTLETDWVNTIARSRQRVGPHERVTCDLPIPYEVMAKDVAPAVEAVLLKHDCSVLPLGFEPHPYRFDTSFYHRTDGTGGILTITLGGLVEYTPDGRFINYRADIAILLASVLPFIFFTPTVPILEVVLPVSDKHVLV